MYSKADSSYVIYHTKEKKQHFVDIDSCQLLINCYVVVTSECKS